MSKDIGTEEHIARSLFGSMLMIVLIFAVLINEEFQIIAKTQKAFGHSISDLFNWGLIAIIFLVFFTYTLPSLVFLVKKIIQDNDY